VANKFKEFKQKHEADERVVLINGLDSYLDALKFDSTKVLNDLDEEISVIKNEIELQRNKAKADEIN
jgi:hypothetical protein